MKSGFPISGLRNRASGRASRSARRQEQALKEKGKTSKKEQPEEFHVKVRGTDYDITWTRKKEPTFGNFGLSRDEVATKGTPEPFGPRGCMVADPRQDRRIGVRVSIESGWGER